MNTSGGGDTLLNSKSKINHQPVESNKKNNNNIQNSSSSSQKSNNKNSANRRRKRNNKQKQLQQQQQLQQQLQEQQQQQQQHLLVENSQKINNSSSTTITPTNNTTTTNISGSSSSNTHNNLIISNTNNNNHHHLSNNKANKKNNNKKMPARVAEEVITHDNEGPVPMDLGIPPYIRRSNIMTEDIAITGFSGRLPESSNIEEFKRNLFDGVDMVNDDPRRWEKGLYGLPSRIGKIKDEDLEQFDSQFFSVHQKQAECMDPQMRMLLESTYEALIDSGYNPSELRGSRTGVYIGVSSSETEQHWNSDADLVNGYGLTGCARAMFANRISFIFDFKGPSYSVDTACSSSLYALEQAFSDMRAGKIDMALVAGCSLIFKPTMSLQFKRMNMLNDEGMCKAFDESGNGYVRSDGVVCIFLQKISLARRVYSTILNVRTNTDGYKDKGITYPEGSMQNRLIRETYEEIGLDPNETVYVEAHGTGTKAGDPQEVNSICDFFCKDRKTPLLMGSVKSNMGHSEPASGVCSIAKCLIAMEEGVIPMNLHYNKPNPDLYGIVDGRIKVIDKNTPWNGGIISVNSFGFGGANAHVILKSNPKPKALTPKDGPPKLVLYSGRNFDAVQEMLEDVVHHTDDDEYLALINTIQSKPIALHYFRGYSVLSSKGALQREVVECNDEKRPIWYIYSGMGSQWGSMAKDMMQFDIFNKSIAKCAEALRTEGVDLIEILTKSTEDTFEDVFNSFISIAAMQVALTDMLTSLNIQPDGIIGHSVGELGCAYADGCFTAEQTILAAYWRGRSIKETPLPKGKMAAIGLTWDEAQKRLPNNVYPVCHNSEDNCTISGPVDAIDDVVAKLSSEGFFARAVKSSGYAFHSKYIADAGPKLRKSLERIIPNAKNRTDRWKSTSIPESAWNNPIAKQSSAAYHVNNLLSPVLFHEAIQHVPKNAIVIEIAPHGLLQAILKRSLGQEATNISLVKRNYENNMEFFLTNIGKLYAAGAQPQVMNLVRPVSFPVGRGTPMLSSKVGWDHTQKWFFHKHESSSSSGQRMINIDLSTDSDAYLIGHTIDGRILFPATGYMTLAWMNYCKMLGIEFHKTPVVLENIVFHRATILNKEGSIKLGINFFDGTGAFEICENGSLAVSGKIRIPENIDMEELPLDPLKPNTSAKELKTNDIYKELRLRGYDYGGIFRGILSSDTNATTSKLQWIDNWVSFMDTMLQVSILGKSLRELFLPTRIEKTIINPLKHLELITKMSSEQLKTEGVPTYVYRDLDVIKSGGIEMRGLKASLAQRRPNTQNAPTLERYSFIPYHNNNDLNENLEKSRIQAITAAIQLMIENSQGALKLKGIELASNRNPDSLMAKDLLQLIEGEPIITADIVIATADKNEEAITSVMGDCGVRIISKDIVIEPIEQNCHFVYGVDVLSRPDTAILENSIACLKDNVGFLLFEESQKSYEKIGRSALKKFNFIPITEQVLGSSRILVLARQTLNMKERNSIIIKVTEDNFNWLDDLKVALKQAEELNQYIYIVCQGEELFGAVGYINCIRNENGGKFARMVFIQDSSTTTSSFNLTSAFYKNQLEKDMITNVLKNNSWGSFRHLKLDSEMATLQVEHAYVNALVKGDLASLKWIEGPKNELTGNSDPNMELCTVYYAPINFRDVMLSSGKLAADALPGNLAEQDCVLGLEFAGRDSNGRRVMAMVPAKSMATTCLANKTMMWEIPDNWSMEEASTIPCVYATVYYALAVRGQMKSGESILIHAGSGGVGQAAISVALHHGLTVFTTVGSKEKREFLKQRFPKLNERYIGNSRDTTFEQMIMRETQGRGVDMVLNSLSEEKLQASVRCLGLNGRFLEIGKFDLSNNSPLGMSVFLKNTSFHGILLDSVMEGEESMQKTVVNLVAEGIKNGAVRPLPTSVFNELQVEQAFRFMASGKHIGKVVVKVREEETVKKSSMKPTSRLINAMPRTYMHPDKSYVIVGGLGGFGLELTNWLVARGAKNIILTSRSGIKTGYQALMIRRWQEKGVQVLIDTNDVTTPSGAKKLLENSNKLGLVGGIFNLAAVLKDALIDDLNAQDYKTVCDPKVAATKYLDKYSRSLCTELDYFVCFSSVSCGRGNIGQSNYGLANSAMERICEMRQQSGFPGTAIQWGAIGDTGLVIENLGDNDTVIGGTLPQRMVSCLQTFDLFLQQPHPVLASMVVADKRKSDQSGGVSIIGAISNIMGLRDLKNIQDTSTLADLGMDSLMSAEIKQTLERNFDIVMAPQEIRQLTFGKLKSLDGAPTLDTNETGHTRSTSPKRVGSPSPSPFGDGTQMVFDKELLPKQVLVKMKSSAKSDSKKKPIFFVSPIEGFVNALEDLAERLDCPVYGLQCTGEAPLDTFSSLAKFYIKHMRTIQPKGPYSIAGYSFGALISYGMALELQKTNEITNLVLLDGAPKYVGWYTQSVKTRYNTDSNQNEAFGLAFFGLVCARLDYGEVARTLMNIPTYERKLEKIAEMLATEVDHPKDEIITAAKVFMQKLYMADSVGQIDRLSVNVTLIKPSENYAKLEMDYGLKETCNKDVEVVTVDGNHRTFLMENDSLRTIESIIKRIIS